MHLALNGFFWNQPYTGSGQYVRQLVSCLFRLVSDLEITLVVPQVAGAADPLGVPSGVSVHSVPIRSGHVGKVQFEQQHFPRICADIGATVAHVPYWGGPLRSPVPLVVTVHDLTPLLVADYNKSPGSRLYNALVTASARGADHIITDSFSSKLDIIDHLGIDESDVTTIYLGVGDEFTTTENNLVDMAVLRKYDLPDFYVLYLGGYEVHKNVTNLIRSYTYVAQALDDMYPLVLAGRKPDKVSGRFPDYEDYIRQSKLNEHVRWIGFVDEEDKPVLYRNAETFVFPSRYEGFGLPPLEAMASGTPVVVANSGSLPEVVGAAGFVIDPEDTRGMAGAIIATIMQEDLAADLRQKGPEQAAKFKWEETATETLLVYDQVLRSSN